MAAGLSKHLDTVKEDVQVVNGSVVKSITKLDNKPKTIFKVKTENNEYEATTLLIASGGRRRKLGIPREDEFIEKGVYYCTICDAPLMANRKVAVIGGGNAGLESIINLMPYASQIYLMEITGKLRGSKKTQEKALQGDKTLVLLNTRPLETWAINSLVV